MPDFHKWSEAEIQKHKAKNLQTLCCKKKIKLATHVCQNTEAMPKLPAHAKHYKFICHKNKKGQIEEERIKWKCTERISKKGFIINFECLFQYHSFIIDTLVISV